MKTKPLKSFDELSIIKDKINNSLNHSTNSTDLFQAEEAETANNYKELSVEDRSKWAAVFDLLEDHFFSDLASGLHKKISSKKYLRCTNKLWLKPHNDEKNEWLIKTFEIKKKVLLKNQYIQ